MPIERSKLDPSVIIHHPEQVNIYDSTIGKGTKIASFVEIGGSNIGCFCKIEAHAFIAPGTIIEDYVFIGPHAAVQNDKRPNLLKTGWTISPVKIKRGAVIGGSSVILGGVTIGKEALVGAGSVVTKDVPDKSVVYGEHAKMRALSGAECT